MEAMQAVILAAGMGRRLGPLTAHQTKCMIELNGRSLIERSLDALSRLDLQRIVLVIGYEGQDVRDAVGDFYGGVPIEYLVNPDYSTTNNIYSLYLARHLLVEDDTLLLESDLVYEGKILTDLLAHPSPNVAAVDQFKSWMDGTVVTISSDHTIGQFIPKKDFNPDRIDEYFKTVNIYKLSREYLTGRYVPFLEAYARSMGHNAYYEQVLAIVTSLEIQELVAMPLTGERWYEIDDVQDLQNARTVFAHEGREYESYLERHGGYWRFPNIRDHCYLVNPYFPPPEMVAEMQRSFGTLLSEYPSAKTIQDELAAKLFDCAEPSIVVGNGAAELISALGDELKADRVGVPIPTFEEYLKRFRAGEVVKYSHASDDFTPDVERLRELLDRTDALVLVNPDNPSGRCLPVAEVLALARYAEDGGKHLILDESFVDFADPGLCTSLLRQDVLEEHSSLVIVKSISKSYGVPGARLGVLASSQNDLVGRVRARMPIWNINSFGEYFLQTIGKYEEEYAAACRSVRVERTRFQEQLSGVNGFRVIPSQANYVLCELANEMTAAEFAERILAEHSVLIRDCTGKPGMEDGQYIRVSVRSVQDNDHFVAAARSIVGPGR
jgi:histidinol-phosphate/aromatic aminotransferase/cobyric acid decarboxylase-like protein/choline kinase